MDAISLKCFGPASDEYFSYFSQTVRRVAKKFGFKEVGEDDDWNLFWIDTAVALERVMEMKRYQVIVLVAQRLLSSRTDAVCLQLAQP